ncbi:MBL fold metallo-hydrolase [uncultured Piscinibacter sp.]|uniref:MBL fold metallo-hydrolase n=1 Tax=uncultured Piscinibacter sp. TaxID=1131835 RepID=UPI00261E50B2|nr:MBL fold metallo-hydrolase [uncultured Piscinibacter sp.]
MAGISRRRVLLGLGATALAGCAATPAPSAAPGAPPLARALAPGVYMVPGTGGTADGVNLGRIGNAGFIVGETGVIAVDTGTSYAHGRAILATIRAVTDRPVRLALITHTRPEFLFGGKAFQDAGVPIRMHSRTARLMAARCENCLKQMRQTVGEAPLAGTALYEPDQQFDEPHMLALIGRPVRVLHFGHASGPGDIAVLDETSGVLFAGGLLDANRVPDIQDGNLAQWKQALAELRGLRPRTVVPGHGPASSAALVDAVERYLVRLEAKARELVATGTSLLDVAEAGDLPEYEGWDQYDVIHRRNASIAFLRFERELMYK